jgi:hypothetical protein
VLAIFFLLLKVLQCMVYGRMSCGMEAASAQGRAEAALACRFRNWIFRLKKLDHSIFQIPSSVVKSTRCSDSTTRENLGGDAGGARSSGTPGATMQRGRAAPRQLRANKQIEANRQTKQGFGYTQHCKKNKRS